MAIPVMLCAEPRDAHGSDCIGPVERYRYEALPENSGSEMEYSSLTIEKRSGRLTYTAESRTSGSSERIRIETGVLGRFYQAVRDYRSQAKEEKEQIRCDGEWAYLQKESNHHHIRKYKLSGKPFFGVDGSLLILMRFYPFTEKPVWPVFMIDFSGETVTLDLRNTGEENVEVPAGTYVCYRMEAVIRIPVLRPKIIFWVAKDSPHFLVKSIGKRGPFTPSYVTRLLADENGNKP